VFKISRVSLRETQNRSKGSKILKRRQMKPKLWASANGNQEMGKKTS
jgi:hypothetical protein